MDNEDILVEILVKLPTKSLCRFSCVCKTWRALIRSTGFVNRHFNQCRRIVLLARKNKWVDERLELQMLYHNHSDVVPLNPDLPNTSFILYGSCHGFLCLSSRIDGLIYLCNPATRESLTLPAGTLPEVIFTGSGYTHRLAIGFGFDAFSSDYKVIKIFPSRSGDRIWNAEIYRLSTNSWSKIDVDLGFISNIRVESRPVYLNGYFHWASDCFGGSFIKLHEIYTFDIHTETFGRLQFLGEPGVSVIGVLHDSLACLVRKISYYPCGTSFDVWVMTDYGNEQSWTKKYSLGPCFGVVFTLTCWCDDKLLLKSVVGSLICCTFGNHFQEICRLNECHYHYSGAIIHQETLVSLRQR